MPDLSEQTLDAVARAGGHAREAAISAVGTSAGMVAEPQEGARQLGSTLRKSRPLLLAAVFAAGFLLGRRSRDAMA